jgi:AmmeMemoRadiSam system protein B
MQPQLLGVYETQEGPLHEQLSTLLAQAAEKTVAGTLQAIIVPDSNSLTHASLAAAVYRATEHADFETVIVIAPSHTGAFRRLTICSVDQYRTPIGVTPIDDGVRNELCDEDDDIYLDDTGHYHHAGVDVHLPFLQTLRSDFALVPIVMGEETPEMCRELGNAIGEVMYNRRTLVVASADILAIEQGEEESFLENLSRLDLSRLMIQLNSRRVWARGAGAILTAVIAAQYRNANQCEIIRFTEPTSEESGAVGAIIWRG